jgi:threonyl-tRNA synthetase
MLIVGDKEAETGTIAPRHRSGGDLGSMTLLEFTEKIRIERDSRANT